MNQEDIFQILSFCKVSTKYFEVSKVFEAIYKSVIYTPEAINKVFRTACYEDDISKLERLVTEQLIDRNYVNYWNEYIPQPYPISIDWKCFNSIDFDFSDEIIKHSNLRAKSVNVYYDEPVKKSDSQFGFELIGYFKCIQNRFESEEPNIWKYELCEVRYTHDSYDEVVAMIDYTRRRYLIISFVSGTPDISCGTFSFYATYGSHRKMNIPKNNLELNMLLDIVERYYDYCCNLSGKSHQIENRSV